MTMGSMNKLVRYCERLAAFAPNVGISLHNVGADLLAEVGELAARTPGCWHPYKEAEGGYVILMFATSGSTVDVAVHGVPQPPGWQPLASLDSLDSQKTAGTDAVERANADVIQLFGHPPAGAD